jgi:chorismate mutase
LQELEMRLRQLLAERREHLQDLAQMKYVHGNILLRASSQDYKERGVYYVVQKLI